MFATDVVKYLFARPGASVGHIIKPLADSLFRIRAGGARRCQETLPESWEETHNKIALSRIAGKASLQR